MGLKKPGPTPNRSPRTIPVINSQQELDQYLQKWRTTVNKTLEQPQTPAAVVNFAVTPQTGGNQISWAAVKGADGYIIYRSASGSFADQTTIKISSGQQTSYFDSSGTGATYYYKIAATAGTTSKPQSVTGPQSGTQSGTSSAAAAISSSASSGGGAIGVASGDLSGTYPNPSVIAIHGGSVPISAAVVGTNGSGQPVDNSATTVKSGDTAGGDLGGTYPNPSVAKVNGGSIPISQDIVGTDGTGKIVAGVVKETDLSLADNTTANTSTSAHGLAPKLPNDSSKYLNGAGNWAVPSSNNPTTTQKKGSGNGTNYQTSSVSYVVVDSTNLVYTVTIPVGWKLLIWVSGALRNPASGVIVYVALADNSTIITEESMYTAVGSEIPFSFCWVITGDGASHTIDLSLRSDTSGQPVQIINRTATYCPVMDFLLLPSS